MQEIEDRTKLAVVAVKAAGELPYEEGVKKERELFMGLMAGTQSAAMRHSENDFLDAVVAGFF